MLGPDVQLHGGVCVVSTSTADNLTAYTSIASDPRRTVNAQHAVSRGSTPSACHKFQWQAFLSKCLM